MESILSKKDYSLFLKDLSAMTGIPKKALAAIRYPRLYEHQGDKWSDFGPYGVAYIVAFNGSSTMWSKNTGFQLSDVDNITKGLRKFLNLPEEVTVIPDKIPSCELL
jgi:hypothetical protein